MMEEKKKIIFLIHLSIKIQIFFKLSIIGKGWHKYVKAFKEKKIEVDFQRFFFRKLYLNSMRNLDYLIYLGNDEGSMSFLDAIQLGIKTIMIPQGFQMIYKNL